MRLANRVAIITGGASGMGLASVFRYLDEGARVVVAEELEYLTFFKNETKSLLPLQTLKHFLPNICEASVLVIPWPMS